MVRSLSCAALLCAALLSIAVAPPAAGQDYFPWSAESQWTYRNVNGEEAVCRYVGLTFGLATLRLSFSGSPAESWLTYWTKEADGSLHFAGAAHAPWFWEEHYAPPVTIVPAQPALDLTWREEVMVTEAGSTLPGTVTGLIWGNPVFAVPAGTFPGWSVESSLAKGWGWFDGWCDGVGPVLYHPNAGAVCLLVAHGPVVATTPGTWGAVKRLYE